MKHEILKSDSLVLQVSYKSKSAKTWLQSFKALVSLKLEYRHFSPISVLSPKFLTLAKFHDYFFKHKRFLIGKHGLQIP